MAHHSTVDISLQGREYRVTCTPDERESLLAAVACVEAKMTEIAARTKGSGERLAVMTALNLAHELLARNAADADPPAPEPAAAPAAANLDRADFTRRIKSMMARLDAEMAQQESLL